MFKHLGVKVYSFFSNQKYYFYIEHCKKKILRGVPNISFLELNTSKLFLIT